MTQGHGLPDCALHENSKISKPSNRAWPSYLAKLMNRECLNLGHSGASNKLITKHIIEQEFVKQDYVIVLWTSFNRTHILGPHNQSTRILPSDADKSNFAARDMEKHFETRFLPENTRLYYKKFYSEDDAIWESLTKINLAKLILDQQNIENHHFLWDTSGDDGERLPNWNTVRFRLLEFDRSLGFVDNEGHPSEHAHKKAAEEIFLQLQEEP